MSPVWIYWWPTNRGRSWRTTVWVRGWGSFTWYWPTLRMALQDAWERGKGGGDMIWGRAESILREDLRTAQDRLLDALDRWRLVSAREAEWRARYEELRRLVDRPTPVPEATTAAVQNIDLDADPFAIDPERQAAIRRAFQEGPEAVLAEMLDDGPTGAVD